MPTSPTQRRPRPHLRQAGATYLVCWELHPSQPPLTGAEQSMMLETLHHFDGTHFHLQAALVLDDKVYALVTPSPTRPLERTVGGWKRWASGQFGAGGRTAPFWRTGYHDRIMRGPAEAGQRIEQLKKLARAPTSEIAGYPWFWVRGEGGEATAKLPPSNPLEEQPPEE